MMRVFLIVAAVLCAALLVPQALVADTEIIIDNPEATMVGEWTTGTMTMTKYGDDYYWCELSTSNGKSATYTPNIPLTGNWEVYTWYPAGGNRPTMAQYIIHSAIGNDYKYVNQQINDGVWVYLGTYTMNAGTSNYVRITNYGSEDKVVMADAVRFLNRSDDTTPPVISGVGASPGSTSATITWITDEPATSQVEYGLTASYGNETTKDTTLVTSHGVTLSGLSPTTLYHYRVKSEDAAGNPAVSGDYTFTTTAESSGEFRAIWVNTWNNGILSASQITNLVNTLAGANYNAVIPEIRKCGDAYYNSAYEPRASNIIDPPPFDPMQDLINKAHAVGIEVHPWIVAYRIWNSGWGSPPAGHIWAVHPDWAMKTSGGSILDGSNYNLDPGVPGVQDYICKVVLDIVSNYDVDGFNWDYIRYPGTSWGYNEITKQRFYDEYGYWPPTSTSSPNWGTWCDYRRQQVTDLVKKCYLEILAVKPHVKHSVDSVGWMGGNPITDFTGTRQYYDVFQDSKSWMLDHIIDLNILMNYKREHDAAQAADYDLWTNWLATMQASSGRHSVDGQACYLNSITNSVHQMQVGRNAGLGLCNYDYRSTNKDGQPASSFFSAVQTNLYPSPVPTPDMPWKSAPTTGIIFGTVTDASQPNDPIYLNWIYKATVQVSGPVTQSTLTDATGTYGFLDLPPGAYTITCSKSGFPTHVYPNQTIAAGDVLREDFDLGYVTASSPSSAVNPAWALISLPMEPVNPDPVSVLSGISLDYRLFRWDKPTQSLVAYDELMPGDFGNTNLDEGYWLYVDSPYTISYQAYGGSAPTRTVSLPRTGWSIVGCPFLVEKNWADMQVTQGSTTVSLETARNNGWIYSIGYYWDSETQSLIDVGLPDDLPTSTTLQPWHGHWVNTYVDNLSLTQR